MIDNTEQEHNEFGNDDGTVIMVSDHDLTPTILQLSERRIRIVDCYTLPATKTAPMWHVLVTTREI